MPAESGGLVYRSGDCTIDLVRRELRLGGAVSPVGARAFEIIEALVRSGGALITKEHLMRSVWPGAIVADNTLQVHISAVRKALGPYRALLRTEAGRGYRLIGDWAVRQDDVAKSAADHGSIAGDPPPTNLPAQPFDLIGRADTVKQLQDLLSAYRMVTLTGPGGIGKTTLAVEVARTLLPGFERGGWLIELASLSDPELVATAVSTVLDLRVRGDGISAEAVARAIGGSQVLLVLDNCEHVVDAAAALAETIVRRCPQVTVLATSREVLRIAGEYVYRVPPLDVPSSDLGEPEDLLGHSAVEFFVARTRAQDSNFAPDAATLATVATICRQLDGIPLAIEFAVARVAVLGVADVAARLEDRFQLLTSGRRTALPRHQTLRAALDWSYYLLPEEERRLLRHLAVFPAGFTADAATAVINDADLDLAGVTEGIANLVAKSLVALAKPDAVSRWYLLDTVRAYALQKLAEHNEFSTAAANHAAYFRNLFADPAAGSGRRFSDADRMRRFREIDNVRAALAWSFSSGGDSAIGADLTAAYAPVWLHLSLMQECRERCERALRGLEPDTVPHARLQMWLQIDLAVSLFDTMGSAEQARELLIEALAAAERLGDLDAQAGALASLVANYVFRAEHGKALAAAERLGQVATRIGDPAIVRIADRLMGTVLVMLGRPREARQLLERFLEAPATSSEQDRLLWYPADHRAAARAHLARALWLQGFLDQALGEAQASLDEWQPTDHQLLLCRVLYYGMCRIAPSTGNFAAAAHSIARLTEVATSLDAPFWQTAGRLLAGKLMIEQGEFAPGVVVLREALETCRRTGWRLSYPEFNGALATGLAGLGRLDEALAAVSEGLTAADQGENGQDLYVAEVLRIKGDLLFQRKAEGAAEECFGEALAMARRQQALFWELRAALSLARIRVTQARPAEARQVLAPVYGRFIEGFAAPDLRAAKALLDGLP